MGRSRGIITSGGGDGDEPLPWLEPADAEADATVVSSRKLWFGIAALAALLIAVVALVYAGVMRPDDTETAGGDGKAPLIRAPESPFKERPANAGGMDVEGVGGSAHAAAEGVDPDGRIALDAMPEEPLDRSAGPDEIEAGDAAIIAEPRAPPTVKAAPKAVATSKPVDLLPPAKAEPASVPAPSSGASALQLGAFSSEAKANAAWKSFSGRYSYLAGFDKTIVPLQRDGKTLYRLRVSGPGASEVCARLKVAGEQCVAAD